MMWIHHQKYNFNQASWYFSYLGSGTPPLRFWIPPRKFFRKHKWSNSNWWLGLERDCLPSEFLPGVQKQWARVQTCEWGVLMILSLAVPSERFCMYTFPHYFSLFLTSGTMTIPSKLGNWELCGISTNTSQMCMISACGIWKDLI